MGDMWLITFTNRHPREGVYITRNPIHVNFDKISLGMKANHRIGDTCGDAIKLMLKMSIRGVIKRDGFRACIGEITRQKRHIFGGISAGCSWIG